MSDDGIIFCVFSLLWVGWRSILEPLLERRISTASRAEELPVKEDGDNRICKLKRKEWSISKSQVIVEKEPEMELTSKMVTQQQENSNNKIPAGDLCFHSFQPRLSLNNRRGSNTKSLGHLSNSCFFIWNICVTDQTAVQLKVQKLEVWGADVSSQCSHFF